MGEPSARDVMVPIAEYPHARGNQPLAEGVRLLEKSPIEFHGRTSMPRILLVFDDASQLIGVVRRRDILRGLEPDYHGELDTTHPEAHFKTEIDPNLSDLVGSASGERLKRKLERPLAEVAREIEASVDAEDSLMKVVRELVARDTHLAIVIENEHVVGVVRTLDVLREVCGDGV